MKTKRRSNVPLRVALVLLCLVLITAHFTSGMYARYVTRAKGADQSGTAVFTVRAEAGETDEDGAILPVSIVADGTDENGMAKYVLRLSNPGQTAVRYEATVLFKDSEEEHNAEKFAPGEDNANLSLQGELAPGATAEETFVLDLSDYFKKTAGDGLDFDNDLISGDEGTVPFVVMVTFTQID